MEPAGRPCGRMGKWLTCSGNAGIRKGPWRSRSSGTTLAHGSSSPLCGYRIDIFDRTAQITFPPQVCRTHSRVVPGQNAGRIEQAVNTAPTETLGRTDAEKVYTLVAAQVREENVPPAQLALMWVSAHMPRTAETSSPPHARTTARPPPSGTGRSESPLAA